MNDSFAALLAEQIAPERATALLARVAVDGRLRDECDAEVSRAAIAQALSLALLDDLLRRVPDAQAYVDELEPSRRMMTLDHGAVRSVAASRTGALPSGIATFARFLEPLGYVRAGVYPLDAIRMHGVAFAHQDAPDAVCQYFVSELDAGRFSPAFQAAVERIVGDSVDPLPPIAHALLAELATARRLPFADAGALIAALRGCFVRCHALPPEADYEAVLAESAEMAWIATEGNAFNHATDRVPDIAALAEHQRRLGRPMKETIETSRSGRVRQTAYRAHVVERALPGPDGVPRMRRVPGSFFEFIARDRIPETGALDLAFDAGNAQGIFTMTNVDAVLEPSSR